MEGCTAGPGTVNVGSEPRGQQLSDTLCSSSGPLVVGFYVRTVYEALACVTVGVL